MKKIILILALFQISQATAQFRYNRFGSRWLKNDSQCQVNTHGSYNFLQQENEFLHPIRLGASVMMQYQFAHANLIGAEIGWSNAKLRKNRIAQILDESPKEYRSLKDMTSGHESNIQFGANYSRIFSLKRCFLKWTLHAGINWNQKRRYSIELYDNTQGGFTEYTKLITKGDQSNASVYAKMDCLFGIPVTRGAAIVFGPQCFVSTPTSQRNEYLEIRNGYLDYADVEHTKSSILSLDFTIGVIFSLDE